MRSFAHTHTRTHVHTHTHTHPRILCWSVQQGSPVLVQAVCWVWDGEQKVSKRGFNLQLNRSKGDDQFLVQRIVWHWSQLWISLKLGAKVEYNFWIWERKNDKGKSTTMVRLNNKANVIIIQNSKFKMIAKVHFNKILIRFCAGIWNHDLPTRVFSNLLASFLLYGIRIFPTDHFSRICSQYATVATSNISQRLYIQ